MAKTRSPLIPPSSLMETISPLANISTSAFQFLLEQIRTREAFAPGNSRRKKIAERLGFSETIVSMQLSILGGLYSRLRAISADDNSVPEIVGSFLNDIIEKEDEHSITDADLDVLTERLAKLLLYSPEVARAEKLNRLSQGFLNNAIGFSTFLDLRPNFTTDSDGKLDKPDGIVPIIQLRISTDSDDESDKSIVVQLDVNSLNKLQKIVERTKEKVDLIKQLPDLPTKIEWNEKQ